MPLREYRFSPTTWKVTPDIKKQFDDSGYIFVRKLLDDAELRKVRLSLEGNDSVFQHAFGLKDDDDRVSRLVVWNHPGEGVTGMIARSHKVATTSEDLLGGEVYHYHTKLMMKEPFTGGKHLWHQDYGYIDRCTKTNGCLEILKGSHKCGRIDHVMIRGQTGADRERVGELEKKLEHLYVEMEPGDALFFHSNLLHSSSANHSPHRRWAYLISYNLASNDPVYDHHHPKYTPLAKVPDSLILDCNNFDVVKDKDFMDPRIDKTIYVEKKE